MSVLKRIKVDVISRQEFEELVIKRLEEEYNGNTNHIFRILVDRGFAALDYDNLDKCLPTWGIHFDPIAVDFGSSEYVWLVSGSSCILVRV